MIMPIIKRSKEPMFKLKGLRAERGYTQQLVANFLGISSATYCRKENGMQEFSMYEIDALLGIFDIKYEDIFVRNAALTICETR